MSLELTFALGAIVVRVLQVMAGALFCWLGFKLFALVPGADSGAEMSFSNQMKMNFTKVGPGVFFSVFGAVILIHGISNPPTLSIREGSDVAPASGSGSASQAATASPARAERTVVVAGSGQNSGDDLARQTLRNDVIQHIRFINRIDAFLRADLKAFERNDLAVQSREIKLKLMGLAWGPAWGDQPTFESWARDNSSGTPNQEARAFYSSK